MGNLVVLEYWHGNLFPTKQRGKDKMGAAGALLIAIGRTQPLQSRADGTSAFLLNPLPA